MSLRSLRRAALLVPALMVSLLVAAGPAAAQSPGDPTMTVGVGDDVAGGETQIQFELQFSGTTANGTPVYIYAPANAVDNPDLTGVVGADPQIDRDPTDEYTPCADASAADFQISSAQITGLGNELVGNAADPGIVQVDTEHYGPIERADPDDEDSDALVVLAYNIVDGAYYDCDATQYTVGYFAPEFIDEDGMNVIVIDTQNWDQLVGNTDTTDLTIEGVIAHELQHLLHNYSDPGEQSWVDEGLADFAIFLNGYPTGGSHATYHQVFHRETSLTRWGGGLENYGASFSFFQYLWEQAGGNGGGDLEPDQVYSGVAGDLLIKLIFQNPADGLAGVQAAIDEFNAESGADLRSAEEFFKDWAVTVYLDDEASSRFDINAFDFGDPATTAWTIALANNEYWGGRDVFKGAVPQAKWRNRAKRGLTGAEVALPYGISYQTYRHPGSRFRVTLDGADTTQVAPHSGDQHWYAGYQSQFDSILDVDTPVSGGQTLDFWSWYFIEQGWDYGFVEALVDGEWQTVPLTDAATGQVVTTDDDPQGNNTEGNGLTGTSGGEYFVDEPQYVNLRATLPAGTTDVRFRYSTDAAYLDTGWFVDDVTIGGSEVALSSPGNWFETNGTQDNHWSLQIISPCDLNGASTANEVTDDAGNFVYRFDGDAITTPTYSAKCAGKAGIVTVVSNLPTGDLQVLDAPYQYALESNPKK
ncbi:MAG TPA: hypothetical protein VFG79_02195 [Solirubrobacter sp.]|nr:hypothetical protein [Solirubrobacter sp.]